jgi:hypothetical protein
MVNTQSARDLKVRLDKHVAETADLHADLSEHAASLENPDRLKAVVDKHAAATQEFHDDALALMQPT